MDSAALLASVRQRAMLPDSPSAGTTDGELLRYASEELQTHLTAWLLRVREEYLVAVADVPLVAGQAAYRVPSRAVGNKLRDVLLVRGGNVRSLPRLTPEDVEFFSEAGEPHAFTLRGASVVLVPSPAQAGDTLRLTYHRRPAALCEVSAAGVLASAAGAALTLEDVPAGVTAGARVDVVRGTSPHDVLAADVLVSSVVGDVVTLASAPSEALDAGDYVCPAGTSPVPQVPDELHTLLAQRVACKALEALGDDAGLQRAKAELQEAEGLALALVTPRVEGEPKLIVTRRGLLHSAPAYRMWW